MTLQQHIIEVQSLDHTRRLAAALSACMQPGDVVVLGGQLGAGKTHFVQAAARALGVTREVASPTFPIHVTYDGTLLVHHFDLYRLDDASQLDEVGYWEALEDGGVCFVEWGDKFADDMPDDYLELSLAAGSGQQRTLSVRPHAQRSAQLLAAWLEAMAAEGGRL